VEQVTLVAAGRERRVETPAGDKPA
jgi:hypothetical protein